MQIVSEHRAEAGRGRVSLYDLSLWFILISLVAVSLLHYLTDIHVIRYHSIYRSLYYVPIAVGAVRYGRRGRAHCERALPAARRAVVGHDAE